VETNLDMLFTGLERGDKGSASRLMTLIEKEGPDGETALKRLYTLDSKALVIGVTGWPGVGKSSLISRIAKAFLGEGKRVGIVAVDPTSPFSGGGFSATEYGSGILKAGRIFLYGLWHAGAIMAAFHGPPVHL